MQTIKNRHFGQHFVEIMIAGICVIAISVSVAQHVFGVAAILGMVGLILLTRSFVGRRD